MMGWGKVSGSGEGRQTNRSTVRVLLSHSDSGLQPPGGAVDGSVEAFSQSLTDLRAEGAIRLAWAKARATPTPR